MRVLALTTTLLALACEAAEDGPASPELLGDARVTEADAQSSEPDASAPPVEAGDGPFIVVADFTEALGFSDWHGADVDAVEWRCGTDGGYAVAAVGEREDPQSGYPVGPALGAPDGPCDPREDCATPLGTYGYLAFTVEVQNLSGCDVTVYELADRAEERFNVYECPTTTFDNSCRGPIFPGTDGAAATGRF